MKYYFSSPSPRRDVLKSEGVNRILISFATEKNQVKEWLHTDLMIDSGAFSLWQSGAEIDIDEYKNFCISLPEKVVCINLDVIPKTGSTQKEKEKCVQQSKENYFYLTKFIKKVLPVHHYGESFDVLKYYMDLTGFLCVSPANDTSEKVKRTYLNKVFSLTKDKYKLHGLGYSSEEGLKMFPFYSVDSISYARVRCQGKGYLSSKKLAVLVHQRVQRFLRLEKQVTEIWEARGVKWD